MPPNPVAFLSVDSLVRTALWILAVYGVFGVFFTAVFQWRGLQTLDAGTRGAGVGFRLLITPGLVALWPLILRKVRRSMRGEAPVEVRDLEVSLSRLRVLHGLVWKGLAWVLPVLLGIALASRPGAQPGTKLPARSPLVNPGGFIEPSR
jgi:hypothetical protein